MDVPCQSDREIVRLDRSAARSARYAVDAVAFDMSWNSLKLLGRYRFCFPDAEWELSYVIDKVVRAGLSVFVATLSALTRVASLIIYGTAGFSHHARQ